MVWRAVRSKGGAVSGGEKARGRARWSWGLAATAVCVAAAAAWGVAARLLAHAPRVARERAAAAAAAGCEEAWGVLGADADGLPPGTQRPHVCVVARSHRAFLGPRLVGFLASLQAQTAGSNVTVFLVDTTGGGAESGDTERETLRVAYARAAESAAGLTGCSGFQVPRSPPLWASHSFSFPSSPPPPPPPPGVNLSLLHVGAGLDTEGVTYGYAATDAALGVLLGEAEARGDPAWCEYFLVTNADNLYHRKTVEDFYARLRRLQRKGAEATPRTERGRLGDGGAGLVCASFVSHHRLKRHMAASGGYDDARAAGDDAQGGGEARPGARDEGLTEAAVLSSLAHGGLDLGACFVRRAAMQDSGIRAFLFDADAPAPTPGALEANSWAASGQAGDKVFKFYPFTADILFFLRLRRAGVGSSMLDHVLLMHQ